MEILWWYWLVFSGILIIFEMFTGTFAFLIIAISGIFGMIANLFGLSFMWQIIVCAIDAIITFVIFKSYPNIWSSKNQEKFNSEALIDEEGIVIETVDNTLNKGLVKVKGEEWRAVSFNNEIIEVNSIVVVKALKGVKILVTKKEN